MYTKLLTALLVTLGMSAAQAGEPAPVTCPAKPQKIKVIDLKSGWWQGDGGDTDRYVIKSITNQCSNVTFAYQHSLAYGGFGGGFGGFGGGINNPFPGGFGDPGSGADGSTLPLPTGPIVVADDGDYDQIWLLSGGEADNMDLRIESAEFQRYLALMKNSKANLFVGTGFGNVYHSNALTTELGLGKLSLTGREVHEYPSPSKVDIVSQITLTEAQKAHPLMKNISVLPHVVNVGGFEAPSDWLASNMTAIVTDAEGKTVIGEATIGDRRLIIDANLARTYLIRNDNAEIKNYLLNIVNVLEKK